MAQFSSLLERLLSHDMPQHCYPSSSFLAHLSAYLNICVPTPLALLSSTLGIFSNASWLFAQLPQIFKNYALGSTNGLSVYFLVEWCLGDSTNLMGALLTRQATWQVVVAAYYVCVDIVLVWQYMWYTHVKPGRSATKTWKSGFDANPSGRDGNLAVSLGGGAPAGTSGQPRTQLPVMSSKDLSDAPLIRLKPRQPPSRARPMFGDRSSRAVGSSRSPLSPYGSPRSLLYLSLLCALASAHPSSVARVEPSIDIKPSHSAETVGRVLSWCSTLLYLGSRLPQLYKNHTRRSTSGLSAKLFIAAFFGNLFYSSSLLTNPCAWSDFPAYGGGGWAGSEGNDRMEWIGRAAPFWLGAAGVLALDGAVGIQFLMFAEAPRKELVPEARGRWNAVSGWMRGWVPSPRLFSPSRTRDPEGDSLLSTEDAGRQYGSL